MRRIAIALDGSAAATAVIPQARRMVGPDGELALTRDASSLDDVAGRPPPGARMPGEADLYLQAIAAALRDGGATVRVPADRDDSSVDGTWPVDMIAYAVPAGDSGWQLSGAGALRRVLADSSVPILLTRPDGDREARDGPQRLLVPLDGSTVAEAALPVAEDLAREWGASCLLTQVVPVQIPSPAEEVARSLEYLQAIAANLQCDARINTVTGRSVATMLIRAVKDWKVTDVVMASHGRTASPRFQLGSVAEALIQHLACRIVVVPAATLIAGRTSYPVASPL